MFCRHVRVGIRVRIKGRGRIGPYPSGSWPIDRAVQPRVRVLFRVQSYGTCGRGYGT